MIHGYYAVDYQVHSHRSHDGKASIADYCARAVQIGLDEIGFSEHKDFDPEDPMVDYFDYDAYMREIEAARKQWGTQLKIRAGVEIDYQFWFEDKIGKYLDTHRFDFVIGSVHYVNRVTVMSPEYLRDRNFRMAHLDYFKAVRDSVLSGLFDILGHLEYCNRKGIAVWGPYKMDVHADELVNIFQPMIDEQMTMELNTAGLHHGLGVTYPTTETLALYAEHGGRRLIFGSDAHHPDQLAYHYAEAAQAAIANGITRVITFEKRQPIKVALAAPPPPPPPPKHRSLFHWHK